MLIDGGITLRFGDIEDEARKAEVQGYNGLWATEVGHDPFLLLSQAATVTSKIELGTGIVVAFGRSPMITATMANDLQWISNGRLLLGLGSQVKTHIEKRYSMPWSDPAKRMREYVLALHAIWNSWHEDKALNFRGEFYRHTLMTPFFNPGPNPYGRPKVYLAAVGGHMTRVAGEVADGILLHPFTTERYLREITLPALRQGLAISGRNPRSFQISYSGMIVTGSTDAERETAANNVRARLAFYGSTPEYRGVLELHGWEDLQPKLSALSRKGELSKMSRLISDEVLDAFSICAPVDNVAANVRRRFGSIVNRFSIYAPNDLDDHSRNEILQDLREGSDYSA